MATSREQIEHPKWMQNEDKTCKRLFKSSKYLKKQMNRFMRRKHKNIDEDEQGTKTARKPTKGWEY